MRRLHWPVRSSYVFLAFLCFGASLLLGWTPYVRRIDQSFYDLFFRRRGPQPAEGRIVIAAIDDATLARYGALPLSREVLAEAVAAIRRAGPRLLAIDLLLTDVSAPEEDAALEEALASGAEGTTGTAFLVLSAALEAGPSGKWLEPLPRFARHAAAVGHVHADPDADGVSRRVLLEKRGDGRRHWALALESFRILLGAPEQPMLPILPILEDQNHLEVPAAPGTAREPVRVPATRAGERALHINYAADDGTFPRVSVADLLDHSAPEDVLKDKVVLLGVTAQGAGDRLFTPFSSAGVGMAGVEIHANILHTLLQGEYLEEARDFEVALAVLLIVAAAAFLIARLHGWTLAAGIAGLGGAVWIAPYRLFLAGEVWPAFSLMLPLGITLLGCGGWQLIAARRGFRESEARRRRSQQQFEMAAHEMRTPLTAIQGSSELLSRYTLDESKREQIVRMIYEESRRLGKLVERFLSVERLSAGEMELRREPVRLASLLAGTAARIRPAAERKDIRLLLEEPEKDAAVEGDAELLEFAVSNLLTNAVKYSPSGTEVRLALECSEGRAAVRVTDSGPGLTPKQSRRVFDRFFRTETAERSENPGFGLGLSIAREIARHHGGHLKVESKPGAGSCFTISLPAKTPAEKPEQKVV